MTLLPDHRIQVFDENGPLPEEAEELFRKELKDSRNPLSDERAGRDQWESRTICAVADSGHLDLGPRNFGPLAADRIAFVEHGIVRRQYRRHGLATTLLQKAIRSHAKKVASACDVTLVGANIAEIALFKKCGFTIACINDGEYFAVKPLQGYACHD